MLNSKCLKRQWTDLKLIHNTTRCALTVSTWYQPRVTPTTPRKCSAGSQQVVIHSKRNERVQQFSGWSRLIKTTPCRRVLLRKIAVRVISFLLSYSSIQRSCLPLFAAFLRPVQSIQIQRFTYKGPCEGVSLFLWNSMPCEWDEPLECTTLGGWLWSVDHLSSLQGSVQGSGEWIFWSSIQKLFLIRLVSMRKRLIQAELAEQFVHDKPPSFLPAKRSITHYEGF